MPEEPRVRGCRHRLDLPCTSHPTPPHVAPLAPSHPRTVALHRIIHTDLALTPGSHFGVYEVTALIGEGGMGQVYRARDTRLNRDVALKVLPDSFASDADRLARFTREAQTLASLNHPNIAAIYGFEEGPAEAGPTYVRS